jgi:exodeoxyribonuclease VII small subunit
MPRQARSDQEAEPPLFEEAVDQLERIVRRMEDDDLSLEELVGEYERGVTLLSFCKERLDEARGRVEAIKEKASPVVLGAGELEAKQPLGHADRDPGSEVPLFDENDGEQEIRLF